MPTVSALSTPAPAATGPARAEAVSGEAEEAEAAEGDLSLPDDGALVRHPDGWYWCGAGGRSEFGPYASEAEAAAAMHAAEDGALEPEETLAEAEQAIGIADWLDPDTGAPAEDTRSHIEDH
jgi:hypothetical protein